MGGISGGILSPPAPPFAGPLDIFVFLSAQAVKEDFYHFPQQMGAEEFFKGVTCSRSVNSR